MRELNLLLKFLLELAAFAALAYWGAETAGVWLAIAAPAVAIVLWGCAAPRSARRLPAAARIPFELAVFALAAIALAVAGATTAAIVSRSFAAANATLLTRFGQWEA